MERQNIDELSRTYQSTVESKRQLLIALQPFYSKSPTLFTKPVKDMGASDALITSKDLLTLFDENIK